MKLKEIEVGMTVVDKYNNEYVVDEIDGFDAVMPVKLKCVKFAKSIQVQEVNDVEFDGIGQSCWVYKSNKVARKDGCDIKCITVKSLKPKDELR